MTKLLIPLMAALAASTVGGFTVAAQTIPTAEARAFLGTWQMPVDVGQPLTLTIEIRDEGGELAASVIGLAGTPTRVNRISRSGEQLVLNYSVDVQGQTAPITIRLTPNGENLSGVLDVAEGVLTADGTATRKP